MSDLTHPANRLRNAAQQAAHGAKALEEMDAPDNMIEEADRITHRANKLKDRIKAWSA